MEKQVNRMVIRKIELMHSLFGEDSENQCKTCFHLVKRQYNRTCYKCECYSLGHSESSDWRVSNKACGLYNRRYDGKPAICMVMRKKPPESQIEGQIGLFDNDSGE